MSSLTRTTPSPGRCQPLPRPKYRVQLVISRAADPAYASIVVALAASRWNDRRTRISLLIDLLLAAASVYAATVLTAEILGATPPGAVVAAYALAAVHGASVAFRRLAPVAAVVGLLSTAAVYGMALGLPVFMLGPAVLFVAYGVGARLG